MIMNVHLADEAVFVDWPALLSLRIARCLGPHLFDVFQDHIAMAIERLNTGKKFSVVAA